MNSESQVPNATVAVHRMNAEGDGCVAYLVIEPTSNDALVIDPRLDQVDQIERVASGRGARVRFVLDTHTHADHLSGVRALAARTGAQVVIHAASSSRLEGRRVGGGDTLPLGRLDARVLHSPGHTPDSLSILVDGHLFTGDALFVGGAGRTDFMGGSAAQLFDTFRTFDRLDGRTVVHPGHDYVGVPEATLEAERDTNPLLREQNRDELVRKLDSPRPPPANMATILKFNLSQPLDGSWSPAALARRLAEADPPLVVDVRSPLEFSGQRVAGSINVPVEELPARVAELPAGKPIALLCRTGVRALAAKRIVDEAGRHGRVVEGGLLAWTRNGLPVLGRARLGLDRQVQLIVGPAVLLGGILGLAVHPAFFAIPLFFGAGLTFAGATGTCGLALVLARAPWNAMPAGDVPSTCSATSTSCSATAPRGAPGSATGSCATWVRE